MEERDADGVMENEFVLRFPGTLPFGLVPGRLPNLVWELIRTRREQLFLERSNGL